MAYEKQTWTAPTGTGLSRYAKSGETETHVELALDPVNLTNTPTPFTMARMAHMEDGIAEADKAQNLAPDAVLHYSFDEIKQIPDDPAGTVYKRDNDWATTDGWGASGGTLNIISGGLEISNATGVNPMVYKTGTYTGKKIRIQCKRTNDGTINIFTPIGGVLTLLSSKYYKANKTDYIDAYLSGTGVDIQVYFMALGATGKGYVTQAYIGDGSYIDPIIDNSYSLAHAENHGVISVDGVCGKAGYFNNSYMIAPRPELADDITIYFWAKFDALGIQTIVQSRTVTGKGLSVFQVANVYQLGFRGDTANFTGYTPPVNTWHHVTMKINATTKVLKINGETKVTLTGTFGLTENLADDIWMGLSGTGGIPSGGNPLTGVIDGFQIIPRYTTDDEDTANYKARGNLPKVGKDIIGDLIGNLTGNASTADKWKTARNITISDADGTNTGAAVSVDGSENETIKLPATIKANVSGKANVRVSLRHGNVWFEKTWTGQTDSYGNYMWTDGENIYYSNATTQHVLNKSTATWAAKTWTGLTDSYGKNMWTDGDNIYHSDGTRQHVLNKATSTWSLKTWTGLASFDGDKVWNDGENIYYSNGTAQFVLNKSTFTWGVKTWTGLTNFDGDKVWNDGENIYYSNGTAQFVLNKSTFTWGVKTWTGLTDFIGYNTWTDGENIYDSETPTKQFVLNKATSTWGVKTWEIKTGSALSVFNGYHMWTDGDNIYFNYSGGRYVLPATRHNYVDDDKYNSLFGTVTRCKCSTLSDRFVFRNE